jgi:hypothetical protein
MKIKEGFNLLCVCDEHILVPSGEDNVDFSNIISLNPAAAYLWEALSQKEEFTVDTMVELLLAEYEVDEPEAREDCIAILECWCEMGVCE